MEPVNTWTGDIGLAPDGTLLRGINPFGGDWGVEDGRVMIGNNLFNPPYGQQNGRVAFASALRDAR